ncbi:MAG TPA: IS630 family transposase [Candidatus Sericytochromatia bacterium]
MVTTLTQKKGWVWKRLRHCPPQPKQPKYNQAKLADWLMLQQWAELELICLKYVDESGFERCSTLNYSYSRRGQQKRIHQSRKRGKRISVLGIWQPQQCFDYGLVMGGFNSQRFLKLIDWQATKAADHFAVTGQITVLVLDNASFHKSKTLRQHWHQWQQQGLFLFFLPPHSPQMNRIEDEWLHLKRNGLSAQVFEDEYEVAMAVIAGIKARGEKGGYQVERFMFN